MPFAGFIADICSDSGVTEIQTSGFASMGDKLEAFLPIGPVTLVCPIAQTKWVCWIDPETGEISARNRSPKKGTPLHVLPEMIYIRKYLHHPNLQIRAVMLEMDEYRLQDGKRSADRKRGSHRYERMPTDLLAVYEYRTAADFAEQLPPLPPRFTSAEFAKAARIRGRKLSAALSVLTDVGVIRRTGKRGNAILYAICTDAEENFHEDS